MEQLLILTHMVVDIVLDHLCVSTKSKRNIHGPEVRLYKIALLFSMHAPNESHSCP